LPDFAEHCSFPSVLPALLVSQLHHQPVQRGEWVMPLPTYFVRLLTGEAVLDDNLAAMSGLYSLKLRDWWPAVVRHESLPRVVPIGSVAGLTQRNRFGLPVGIPVVLAGNDQTAGAYGARLDERGDVLLTLGTAQVAYQCLARPPAARAGLVRGPFFGGRFYRLAVAGAGGNLINWAETVIRGCTTNAQFFATASRAPAGCHDLVFELDAKGGAWRNMGLQHTSADLARAVVEGVSRELARQVAKFGRQPVQRRLWVAGGGSRRALWVESVAAALSRELCVTAATPLDGAARAVQAE
jgi:sugar (pentulose or hexulose) kinase